MLSRSTRRPPTDEHGLKHRSRGRPCNRHTGHVASALWRHPAVLEWRRQCPLVADIWHPVLGAGMTRGDGRQRALSRCAYHRRFAPRNRAATTSACRHGHTAPAAVRLPGTMPPSRCRAVTCLVSRSPNLSTSGASAGSPVLLQEGGGALRRPVPRCLCHQPGADRGSVCATGGQLLV